jgi:anti-sigma-K factor RskA
MLPDNHVSNLIPAYALDCLNEDEKSHVAGHLVQCLRCREELVSYQNIVDELHQAVPPAMPPAGLKRKILLNVQPKQAPAGSNLPTRIWQRFLTSLQTATPVWAYASFVLVLLLAASNVWLLQRLSHPQANVPGEFRMVALSGVGQAPRATGLLVLSQDGNLGTLVVDSLPALDAAHQYQLWLIKNGARTSGGVFSVSPDGYAALAVSSAQPLKNFSAFGVTIEPAGGSSGPTGEKVLGGSS